MKLVVIDIEVASPAFPIYADPIVEIAAVELDLKDGKKNLLFDKIIKEDNFDVSRHSNSWIFSHSTLKPMEVDAAYPLEIYRDQIQSILNTYPITAFNRDFDIGFLKNRKFTIEKMAPCPMQLATPILKIPHLRYQWKYPNLEEAYRHYFGDTGYVESHRAFSDANHEAALVWKMYRAGDYSFQDKVF